MKFLGSCIGKMLTGILCILLGVVLTLGGIVGAGYLALTSKGVVGKIDDAVEQVNMPEETRAMSVLEFGETLLGYANTLTSAGDDAPTIGELEDFIGSDAISDALFNVIGVDPAVIKEATFATLGEKLTDSLTLGTISDKFGIALPDMPLFNDTVFMDETPLSEAFGTLTDRTIGDFVNIEDNATGIMAILKDTTIGGVSDKINTVTLGEIIGITEDTSPLILAIQDLTINDLGGEKLQECIDDLKLSDIMTDMDPETTNAALYAMRDLTVKDLQGEDATKAINSMFLGELMTIDSDSNRALQSMQYACIDSSYKEIGTPSSTHEEYALTTPMTFVYETDTPTDGYYSVYYYPEEINYDCVLNGEDKPVKVGTYYKVTYYLYTENSGFSANTKNIYGIDFLKVYQDGNEVTDKDGNVKVTASVCIDQNDIDKVEDNKVYLKNRYHVVYDVTNHFAFYNGREDTTKKGTLRLPDWALKAGSVNATDGTMQFYNYYLIDDSESPTQYFDTKEVKTSEGGSPAVYERKPLRGLSKTMDGLSLGQMVDTDGNRLLTALADSTLENIGTDINMLFIDQIMEITSSDSKMLQAIRFACLQSQTEDIVKTDLVASGDIDTSLAENVAIMDKCLSSDYEYYYKVDNTGKITEIYVLYRDTDGNEVIDAGKTKFYQTSLYQADGESQEYYRPLMGMNDKTNELEFGDVVDMGTSPSQIMTSLEHTKVTKIGDKLNTMTLGEMTDTSTNHLLSSLSDCTLDTLGTKISNLTLEDVFEPSTLSSGVLSLIDKDTQLDDISSAVATAVQTSSVAVLVATGVIGNSSFQSFGNPSMKEEYSAFIYNSTMTDMLGGLVDFVVEPYTLTSDSLNPVTLNDGNIKPTEISVSATGTGAGGNFVSITEFMTALAGQSFEQGYALNLSQNITVEVDATVDADYYQSDLGVYVLPFFELSDSINTITFNGATVKLGCYDDLSAIATSFSTHQAGYLYDKSNSGSGSGIARVAGMSVKSDFVATP